MSTRKDLPNPNAPNFLQRVREEIHALLGKTGSARDRALTLADAINSGVIGVGPGGSLVPGPATGETYEPDLTPPPTPTGFAVDAAISHVFIEHDPPLYRQGHGHLRTRVYGVTHTAGDPLPVFADAVEVGQFEGTVWALPSNPATTWHLWIKWETRDGVLSASPAGGTNGLSATTGQDVALLLDALAGQITESQLYNDLASRIDLIDGPSSLSGSVAQRVAAEANARANAVAQEATTRAQAILDEAAARGAADGNLQQQIDLLAAAGSGDFSELLAAVQEEQTARIAGDTAEATARQTLATQMRGAYTGTDPSALTTGLVYNERQARITADGAISSNVSALSATVSNNYNTLNAAITSEQTARANADSALSTTISGVSAVANAKNKTYYQTAAPASGMSTGDLWFDSDDSNKAYRYSGSAWVLTDDTRISANAAAITAEQTARANADSALSTTINTVSATANSKNKTYRQTSAPTSGMTAGDLWFDSDDNNKAYRYSGTAWTATDDARIAANAAAIVTEQSARANADTALAQQITTLSSTVNGNTAAIQTEATTRASETGNLFAKYTVKVDVAGHVSGYGLASGSNAGDPVTLDPGSYNIPIERVRSVQRSTPATYVDGSGVLQTAAVDVPRFQGGQLLVESAGTNLALQSSNPASWALSGFTLGATATAPDGTSTAQRFLETVDPVGHFTNFGTIAFEAGKRYVFSVFAAEVPGGLKRFAGILLTAPVFGASRSICYDLATGSMGTPVGGVTDYGVQPVAGGFRIWLAFVAVSSGSFAAQLSSCTVLNDASTVAAGNTSSGIIFWGRQVEQKDSGGPSSYTDTSDAQVTRGADTIVVKNEAVTSEFGIRADQFFVAPPSFASGVDPAATWGSRTANAVAFDGRFVAGGAGAFTATSYDGLTWESLFPKLEQSAWGATADVRCLFRGSGIFIAGGDGGRLATSADGITWTYQPSLSATSWGTTAAVLSGAWSGSVHVLLGQSGRAATSADGVTWTYRSGLSSTTWGTTTSGNAIVWGGGRFVAGGTAGRIATSTDGASWTYRAGLRSTTWGTSAAVNGLAWSGSAYLAVGDSGRAATSTDGTTWTYRAGLSATSWGSTRATAVIWDGARFVVTGENGLIATSPDGIAWTVRPELVATAWASGAINAIALGAGKYVVVGINGASASSADLISWDMGGLSSADAGIVYRGFVWVDTSVTPNVTRYYTGSAWSTTPQALPFVVQVSPTTINGVAVQPGAYFNDAFIQNGTITNAKIANLAVDDAKIANLSVSKLTAGSIAVGQYIQSTGYVAGSSGWRINGDGTAEFSQVVVRGTIFASQGSIGGWNIGSTYLQSTTYVLGESGTRLNSDGTGQIGGVTVYSQGLGAGSTAYNTGDGAWLGRDGKLSLRSASGSSLTFDGANVRAQNGDASRVLDLGATGASSVLKVGSALDIKADGSATFAGSLNAATGTFNGSLTASAIDAVDTINIAGNAVTSTVSVFTAGLQQCTATNTWQVCQTAVLTSSGGQVLLLISGLAVGGTGGDEASYRGPPPALRVRRGGVVLTTTPLGAGYHLATALDSPGAGTFTYTLEHMTSSALGGSTTKQGTSHRGIHLLLTKR